jgi:nucleotide-binding universal stress UspA family protein
MASRGHGGLWRLGIGSTTDALVRSLSVPMIVMRAEEEQEKDLDREVALGRIVVALDGSDAAEASLGPAVELALALGGSLTLLRIIETPTLPASTYMPHAIELTREHVRRETESANAYLARIADRLRAHGVPVQTVVRESTTASTGILRFARESEANLISISTHGRGRASRLLIGSSASRVLHDSGVPVLITNTSAEARE